jgi:hypothetical protein
MYRTKDQLLLNSVTFLFSCENVDINCAPTVLDALTPVGFEGLYRTRKPENPLASSGKKSDSNVTLSIFKWGFME